MENSIQPHTHNIDLADCLAKTADLIAYNHLKESAVKLKQLPHTDNRHLLLALSGGSDSTALLIALSQIAPAFDFRLNACHINHGLRADESEGDAEFCQQLCRQLNIECEIIKLPIAHLSANTKGHFSEAALREKRYECLTNFARQKGISFILTAHTLDDQVETLLFRLFRGTSMTGLRGIEPYRELAADLYLLRPLLKLSKAQCQEYLKHQNIEAREDSSNFNETYSRNYIRHKIVPAINRHFPDFSIHLDCLRDIISNEDALLEKLSSELLVQLQSTDANIWPIEIFEKQTLAMQRRVLACALKERSIALSFKRLDEIANLIKQKVPQSGSLNLNKNWRLSRVDNQLFWQEMRQPGNNAIKFDPLEVKIPSINFLPGLNMTLSIEAYPLKASDILPFDKVLTGSAKSNVILADLSRIKPPLIIRQRLPGDRISPLGMSQSVKLKKYIHTHKNGNKSPSTPYCPTLLADQEEVLWLPGIGISEKIKVRDIPSHILEWRNAPTSAE